MSEFSIKEAFKNGLLSVSTQMNWSRSHFPKKYWITHKTRYNFMCFCENRVFTPIFDIQIEIGQIAQISHQFIHIDKDASLANKLSSVNVVVHLPGWYRQSMEETIVQFNQCYLRVHKHKRFIIKRSFFSRPPLWRSKICIQFRIPIYRVFGHDIQINHCISDAQRYNGVSWEISENLWWV